MADWIVVEAPTSAGSHHAGQELAPAALRARGLFERLTEAGMTIVDTVALPPTPFLPAAREPSGRDAARVTAVAASVADAVEAALRRPARVLVVGGDCTVSVGMIAGLVRVEPESFVAYLDGDADLADPATSAGGIMDASGVATLLGLIDSPLGHLGPRHPLLTDIALAMLGFDTTDPGAYDEQALAQLPGLIAGSDHAVRANPERYADLVRARMDAAAASAVHFDVDSIDSGELPLANFPHYGTGIGLRDAAQLLGRLLAAPSLRAVSLTEVNPTHDVDGRYLDAYVRLVTDAFAG